GFCAQIRLGVCQFCTRPITLSARRGEVSSTTRVNTAICFACTARGQSAGRLREREGPMVATRGRHLRTLALFCLAVFGIPVWASAQADTKLDRILSVRARQFTGRSRV